MTNSLINDVTVKKRFDGFAGLNSQRAVRHYLKLISHYENAVRDESRDCASIAMLEVDIQKARDDIQTAQGRFGRLEEQFHDLSEVPTDEIKDMIRRYAKYLAELPTDFSDPAFVEHRFSHQEFERGEGFFDEGKWVTKYTRIYERPIQRQREFFENAIEEMTRALGSKKAAGPPINPIAAKIQEKIEMEVRLRQQCANDITKHPDQEQMIRRAYGKAIDALREEP